VQCTIEVCSTLCRIPDPQTQWSLSNIYDKPILQMLILVFFSRREYQLHRPLQIPSHRVLRMSRLQYLIGGCDCPIIYADGVAAEVMRICEFSPQRGYLNIINFENTSCANHQSHHCACLRELTVFSYHNRSVPSPGRA
jgi:hypothetical protein